MAFLDINGVMKDERKTIEKSGKEEKKKRDPLDHDVVLLHSPTEKGDGVRALRFRPGRLDLAELHPVQDGQSIGNSELIKLTPNDKVPFVCDVDVLYSPKEKESSPSSTHAGPVRVSSCSYRQNWDRIFGMTGTKAGKKQLLH